MFALLAGDMIYCIAEDKDTMGISFMKSLYHSVTKKYAGRAVFAGLFLLVVVFSLSAGPSFDTGNAVSAAVAYIPESAIRFFGAYVPLADAGVACPPSDQDWSGPSVVGRLRSMPFDPYWLCIAEHIMYKESSASWNAQRPTGPYRGVYQFSMATWKGALSPTYLDRQFIVDRGKDVCNSPVNYTHSEFGLVNTDVNPDYMVWDPYLQIDAFYAKAYVKDRTCSPQWQTCSAAVSFCASGGYTPSF